MPFAPAKSLKPEVGALQEHWEAFWNNQGLSADPGHAPLPQGPEIERPNKSGEMVKLKTFIWADGSNRPMDRPGLLTAAEWLAGYYANQTDETAVRKAVQDLLFPVMVPQDASKPQGPWQLKATSWQTLEGYGSGSDHVSGLIDSALFATARCPAVRSGYLDFWGRMTTNQIVIPANVAAKLAPGAKSDELAQQVVRNHLVSDKQMLAAGALNSDTQTLDRASARQKDLSQSLKDNSKLIGGSTSALGPEGVKSIAQSFVKTLQETNSAQEAQAAAILLGRLDLTPAEGVRPDVKKALLNLLARNDAVGTDPHVRRAAIWTLTESPTARLDSVDIPGAPPVTPLDLNNFDDMLAKFIHDMGLYAPLSGLQPRPLDAPPLANLKASNEIESAAFANQARDDLTALMTYLRTPEHLDDVPDRPGMPGIPGIRTPRDGLVDKEQISDVAAAALVLIALVDNNHGNKLSAIEGASHDIRSLYNDVLDAADELSNDPSMPAEITDRLPSKGAAHAGIDVGHVAGAVDPIIRKVEINANNQAKPPQIKLDEELAGWPLTDVNGNPLVSLDQLKQNFQDFNDALAKLYFKQPISQAELQDIGQRMLDSVDQMQFHPEDIDPNDWAAFAAALKSGDLLGAIKFVKAGPSNPFFSQLVEVAQKSESDVRITHTQLGVWTWARNNLAKEQLDLGIARDYPWMVVPGKIGIGTSMDTVVRSGQRFIFDPSTLTLSQVPFSSTDHFVAYEAAANINILTPARYWLDSLGLLALGTGISVGRDAISGSQRLQRVDFSAQTQSAQYGGKFGRELVPVEAHYFLTATPSAPPAHTVGFSAYLPSPSWSVIAAFKAGLDYQASSQGGLQPVPKELRWTLYMVPKDFITGLDTHISLAGPLWNSNWGSGANPASKMLEGKPMLGFISQAQVGVEYTLPKASWLSIGLDAFKTTSPQNSQGLQLNIIFNAPIGRLAPGKPPEEENP